MKKQNVYYFIKLLVTEVILATAYIFVAKKDFNQVTISDICFTFGLINIIIALFRITKLLRFYDLVDFGIKKLKEIIFTLSYDKSNSQVGDYYNYVNLKKFNKPITEYLVVGIIFILVSLVSGILL